MKKRMLALSSILGMSFMLLTGFDSSVTPETILENASAAISNASSLDFNMGLDFLLNMEMLTRSGEDTIPLNVGMGISGNIEFQAVQDQSFATLMNLSMISMGTSEQLSNSIYLVPNEDGYDSYTYDSNIGTWSYQFEESSDTQETLDQLKGLLSGDLPDDFSDSSSDLSDLSSYVEFTLSDQPVTVNGVSCYELTSTIDGSLFSENQQLIDTLFSMQDMDETSMLLVYYMLDGINIDISYYVAVDTNLPVQVLVDFSETDLSILSQLIELSMSLESDSSAETSFDFSLDSALITINIDTDNLPTVTVPQEALNVKEQSTSSESDALN